MNAERLLGHYKELSDTPDAISRLRRFILDLAVRGNLVEQAPSEGGAAPLLVEVERAWAARMSTQNIKRKPVWEFSGLSDVPFKVPDNWALIKLGQAVDLINGRAFKPSDWTPTGLPIVRIQNLNNPLASFNRYDGDVKDKFLIDTGDLLISWSGTPGTSFGAHIWDRGPAVLNPLRVKFTVVRASVSLKSPLGRSSKSGHASALRWAGLLQWREGCVHEPMVTGGGKAAVERPESLGDSRQHLRGTYHAIRPKYAQRYLAEFEYRFNQHIFKSIPIGNAFESLFLKLAINARLLELIEQAHGGVGLQHITKPKLEAVVLTLPPRAEQHRIVAKVDELMALCDRLVVARTEREMTRNRLATASLARLNAPDPDPATFQNHAVFALENLTPLTTRPDQIKALRQTILNLAIRGKLVEQDANDEPASELLDRIALERARLVKTGEIRKEKKHQHQPTDGNQGTFQIPTSWSWCRLGGLSKAVTSGSRDWAKYYSDEGAVFVRMGNLSKEHYRLRLDNIQRVKAPSEGEGTRTRLEAGDLLISITGDVGMLGLIPENFGEAYINQHTAMVRPMDEMKGRYLPELFRSPFAQEQFNAPQRGIKNSFRLTDITQFLVPLPPLAEQHRIVAKVDELMALCDRLEDRLATGSDTGGRLVDAVLHDALNG